MQSKISELLDFVKANDTEYDIALNSVYMNDDGTIDIPIASDKKTTVTVSGQGLTCLSKILNIPPKYSRSINSDLLAVNINYLAKRSKDVARFVLSSGILSEVKLTDSERSIAEIIKTVADAFEEDVFVLQPLITENVVAFYVYQEEEIDTKLGIMHEGIIVWCPIQKDSEPSSSPILVNAVDESVIEFNIDEKRKDALQSTTLKDVVDFAIENFDIVDKAIDSAKNVQLHDSQHFATHYGSIVKLNTSNKKNVIEEISLANATSPVDIAKAVMLAEARTKSQKEAYKLGHLAGMTFIAEDPLYCKECHQEIDSLEEEKEKEII